MASRQIEIERHDQGSRGEYVARVGDEPGEGKLSWTQRDGVRHAEHTFVPQKMRGRGIAAELVDALVADARSQGFKIAPDCSYVASSFKQHPEWADLRA